MKKKYREVKGHLGFFGIVWRILLFGWQLLMIIWFFAATTVLAPVLSESETEWEQAGAGLGIAISWGLIAFFWVAGTIVLGLFVLLTHPARAMVPVDDDNKQ